VVLGHSAVVHGRRIGAKSLIGMRACILSRSEIGAESIIAAGALISEGTIVPPRSVVMGVPGRVVRRVEDHELAQIQATSLRYRELAEQYVRGDFHSIQTTSLGR